MTTINTFEDILTALEQNPALRDSLRRHILTEELLQLPARFTQLEEDVAELKAGQARLEEDVSELKAGQARLEEDVSELKAGQARLEGRVTRLEEGQARLESDVSELKAGQSRLESGQARLEEGQTWLVANQNRMQGQMSNIIGSDYERKIVRMARRTLRRHANIRGFRLLQAITVPDRLDIPEMADEAVEAGRISESDADELDQTDLIAAGVNDENRTVYIVAEVSLTIHSEDIDRAAMRAGILAQAANAPAKAMCLGAGMAEQTAEYAAARNVITVIVPE